LGIFDAGWKAALAPQQGTSGIGTAPKVERHENRKKNVTILGGLGILVREMLLVLPLSVSSQSKSAAGPSCGQKWRDMEYKRNPAEKRLSTIERSIV